MIHTNKIKRIKNFQYWLKHGHGVETLKPIVYKPIKKFDIMKWVGNIKKYGKLYIGVYVFFKVLEITLIIWLVLR